MDTHLDRLLLARIGRDEIISSLYCLAYDLERARSHPNLALLSLEHPDWYGFFLGHVANKREYTDQNAIDHAGYCRLCKGET